ncbi:MAG: hypothetical protein ACM3PY_16940 [Omnitrophica WOR_2 bacterium]
MDIYFQDPSEVPLPPDEVRIRSLKAEPWPDGRRIKIYLEVDPFQRRPNAEVQIKSAEGMVIAQTSVIESMTRKMEFNLHLRQEQPDGEYTVLVRLFYTDPIVEPKEGEEIPVQLPASTVVDEEQTTFTLGSG